MFQAAGAEVGAVQEVPAHLSSSARTAGMPWCFLTVVIAEACGS
jgi:hypothetical protein